MAAIDDVFTRKLEALKAALESSKQLVTLATAFIVITGTFLQVFVGTPVHSNWLYASWVLMVGSIIFGVAHFGRAIALLNDERVGLDGYVGSQLVIVEMGLFVLGLICFGVFIYFNLQTSSVSTAS